MFQFKISQGFILESSGNIEQGCNKALKKLGLLLQSHGKHLGDYRLPQPLTCNNEVEWELHRWSLQVDVLKQQVKDGLSVFNPEQRDIFSQVQSAVLNSKPLLMFIDGKVGRGKMFLVNMLRAWVRSVGKIALPTATSAFAAQLYPGGRTTHSTFGVRW
jgi:PIF1-like helicase